MSRTRAFVKCCAAEPVFAYRHNPPPHPGGSFATGAAHLCSLSNPSTFYPLLSVCYGILARLAPGEYRRLPWEFRGLDIPPKHGILEAIGRYSPQD
jgi:hypothetical protein